MLDSLLALVDRVAVTKSRIQQEVLRRHGILPVLRRAHAEAVGEDGVDFLLQGIHGRVPSILRDRDIESPQRLDLPVDLVDRARDRSLIVGASRWRCVFTVGHADSLCNQPEL
ncbi:hypothetical protein [Polaromonas sp. JS666]|uniref:hypothetical protein n=1 Tax=Polaromonas sp. (strain JS666 / ATCC BAA-500) TaxID=296591 RepID=UPI00059BC9A1|nr:hypothetical protein [Polaromonas sp. JS666]